MAMAIVMQNVPGKQARVMAVAEGKADGVIANRINAADRYVSLSSWRCLLSGAMSLNLCRRRLDPQQLGRYGCHCSIIKTDIQAAFIAAQADFGRPALAGGLACPVTHLTDPLPNRDPVPHQPA